MAETLKGSEEGIPGILSYANSIPGTSDSEVGQYFRERIVLALEEVAQTEGKD